MKAFTYALCAGVAVILSFGSVARATSYSYTVAPSGLADGPAFANGQGGKMFGYDPDMPPPIGSTLSGAPGFGPTSFWSNVQGSAAGGPRDYTSLRLSPKDIFGVGDVTIGDLASVSYWTKNLDTSYIDWQLRIYTESSVKWYGYRFNFTRPNAGDNNWHNWVTDTDLTVSDIYDKAGGGYVAVPGTGLLSDLISSYGSEKILFMDIGASYATNSPPVDSLLDGVQLKLQNGDTATIDLVPAPGAALLAMIGLGAVTRFRRRFGRA